LNNGPRASRFNIVVFSEGYTGSQLSTKFPADARRFIDELFATEPYKEYKAFFNVFTIAVASAQSGSDHPATSVLRDTYFNSSYEAYGIERLLMIPPNDFDPNYADGQGKVDELLASLLPDYDLALMIVNDPVYGGSGGSVGIASLNASGGQILIHESGHTVAGLVDEYDDLGARYDTEASGNSNGEPPNATQETNRALIKWRRLINSTTPIPTPETPAYEGVVGLFEGAWFQAVGWYRPKITCVMKDLGAAFCPVCSTEMVLNVIPPPGTDLNHDHRPDLVLLGGQRNSAIWYLFDNQHTGGAYGPSIPSGYELANVRDFNGDSQPDYLLFNPMTRRTAVWYLSGNTFSSSRYGPVVPAGWSVVGVGDFNLNGTLDYLLYQATTRRTAVWYLNSNLAVTTTAYGPILAPGYSVAGVDDFNLDGKIDLLLFNNSTRQTAAWHLSNNAFVRAVDGPTIPGGWVVSGAADFDRNGRPDLLLYSPSSRKTAIWYLNNSAFLRSAFGPTIPSGYTLAAPK
jgi:hypothetical protein